jgi:hypothetical protein
MVYSSFANSNEVFFQIFSYPFLLFMFLFFFYRKDQNHILKFDLFMFYLIGNL